MTLVPNENWKGCNHCNEVLPLTAEHIPARSAGNDVSVKATNAYSYLGDEPTEFVEHPAGYTKRTLCADCNTRGSAEKTVDEYRKLREIVIEQAELAHQDGVDMLRSMTGANIVLPYDFMPNRFARQVVGMALASQLDPSLLNNLDTLQEVARSEKPDPGDLTLGNWRLTLSLFNDVLGLTSVPIQEVRISNVDLWLPPGVKMQEKHVLVLVMTPFVFVLTDGSTSYGTDITQWVSMGHHQRLPQHSLSLELTSAWNEIPHFLRRFGYVEPQTG